MSLSQAAENESSLKKGSGWSSRNSGSNKSGGLRKFKQKASKMASQFGRRLGEQDGSESSSSTTPTSSSSSSSSSTNNNNSSSSGTPVGVGEQAALTSHANKGMHADVIIVGAGLSGLAAAKRVRELGFSVLVFEASGRMGGRILTEVIDRGPMDFGSMWFNPHTHSYLGKLVTNLQVPASLQYDQGDSVIEVDSEQVRYNPRDLGFPTMGMVNAMEMKYLQGKLEGMARTILPNQPQKSENGVEWDDQTVQTFKDSLLTAGSHGMIDILVRGHYGAEPRELSLLHFLFSLRTARGIDNMLGSFKGTEVRFNGGAKSLIDALAERIGGDKVIALNSPVRSIQQGRVTARVVTEKNEAYTARYVIVAVPPHMAQRIDYFPPLPPIQDQFMQRVPMGYMIVVVATYRSQFWKAEGLSGMAMSAGKGPVTLVYDCTSADMRQPALCAYLCGQKAREWGCRELKDRKRAVLRHVANLVGEHALQPLSYKEKDWSKDIYARGSVGTVPPGFWTGFGDLLRRPFQKVYWSCSELAIVNNGMLDGAVESGERVANEICRKLQNEKDYLPPPTQAPAPPSAAGGTTTTTGATKTTTGATTTGATGGATIIAPLVSPHQQKSIQL